MTALASSLGGYFLGTPGVAGPVLPGSEALPGATGGIFGKGGEFNLETALSTGLNFGSASLSMFAGEAGASAAEQTADAQARALEMQSQEDLLQARREQLRGKEESNQILSEMIQAVGERRVVAASSGTDAFVGTPVSLEREVLRQSGRRLSAVQNDAFAGVIARRRQALERSLAAGAARRSGRSSATALRMEGLMGSAAVRAEQLAREDRRG